MINKKGQSALEFLTTYGWAFLVILIMIGALGYFGILNPTKFLPERCSVGSDFNCEEFSLVKTGDNTLNLSIVLSSNVGQAFTLSSTDKMNVNSTEFGKVTIGTCTLKAKNVSSDDNTGVQSCTITTTSNLPAKGNKVKFSFAMPYKIQGGLVQKQITGEVFGVLQ